MLAYIDATLGPPPHAFYFGLGIYIMLTYFVSTVRGTRR